MELRIPIGLASELLDCAQSTLRRLEKEGIIPRPVRRHGWRLYSESDLKQIREYFDKTGKRDGFR